MINKEHLMRDLQLVREKSPLIHNITNYVVTNFTANTLLAVGASPVMAHAIEEVEEMTSIAGALVINIGTLDTPWITSMLKAGKAMHSRGGVIVLDPVGAGATKFRTETAWKIINECHPTIIRGNGSEIMALINADVKSKGVDSSADASDALDSAKLLAKKTGAVVCISGKTDYITDGERVEQLNNGSKMQTLVTGMGCTSSSMVGVFAAINPDAFEATLHAMALMGVAGEMAAQISVGPGSLLSNFNDLIYTMTPKQLANNVKQ
jgi:hydroxyethylthiazole kinase